MRINIELNTDNKGDLRAFFDLLTGFGGQQLEQNINDSLAATVLENVSAALGTPAVEPVAAEPAPAPAVEQPKRTRRTKAEIEAARAAEAKAEDPDITRTYNRDELLAAAKQAATQPAETPAPSTATPLPPATEQSAASVSIDDLRAALQGYTSAKGMPAGIELLKKFGCSRISELAAKDEVTKQGFLKEATV